MTDISALMALRHDIQSGATIAWGHGGSPSRKALPEHWHDAMNAYLGSLDAAHALHKAVLQGWVVENIGNACIDGSGGWRVRIVAPDYLETFMCGDGHSETPARAWLLAIISALIAQEAE